ncbi:UDP-3-O-[3-hydroxymyristoyl] N-acetylglucosamine deacetylase [candidate division KSB1 bacterium]|nr:MAG: UDP-3-O-[3-hydroxymyristoyl] N-acetylglucosamine deacetylase [candidate division KSB1 bacterium 4484_219]RKY79916.1 MAG: UDP-3-O-[3-hydroxymyristoyl] N-acetylglucosamine deacetylase [candidate division KSB1 bacterium]HDI51933.1 bifunctional UDP-3-O-[3-hydroxymyristoyl] N-acetylglucosamine deacetylase/3-hydroxyacyl-ACP dehydratase [Bacteroidota bacterium]RKY80595.1 MAG: UDP-3-O-[3-hydroxymyristoyl] N-acetylglucosamine deacetylase [candidate division KSB1 bacterium]RKY87242.1 MAG: UDP-3-O
MLKNQRTIQKPISLSGVGLHTGNQTNMTFRPAPINTGIRFIRTDLEGKPEIPADIDHVVDLSRGTTIGIDNVKIHTVEHTLAAIYGLEIDNLYVELDSNEPPVFDGSSLPFVEKLTEAGIVEQDSPKDYLIIDQTITYNEEDRGVDLVVMPSDEFRITFMVDYQNPALGTQYTSMYSLTQEFVKEYAPARTFCFLHEVEDLAKQGLIKGGNLDVGLVIIDRDLDENELNRLKDLLGLDQDIHPSNNGILNNKPLRFKNEPVRHKALDLIGDLALLGVPLQAHVLAARSGHKANVELVKKIRKIYEKKLITKKFQGKEPESCVLDIQAIQKVLPHRYPFLLVDRIIDFIPQERVVGIKNVTINEPFFNGHFPGHPIMPGVLIIEAMAQVGGIMLLNSESNPEKKLIYFMGMDNVRFRKPVLPGDQIRFELDMLKYRRTTCKMAGKAFVGDDLVAEAELLAAIVDRE